MMQPGLRNRIISLENLFLWKICFRGNYSGFLLIIKFLIAGFFTFSFHTYDYARHFVSACTRILGLEGTPEGVENQGKLTRVAAVYILLIILFLLSADLQIFCLLI